MKTKKLFKFCLHAIILAVFFTGCKDDKDDLPIEVKSVTFDKTELTLSEGGETTLTATITPDDADNKNLTWESSNTTIATVDNTGKVIAVKEGSAVISATSVNDIKATCTVTVTKQTIPVTSISLDKTTMVLAVNAKDTLKATVKPDEATNKKVLWSSNNTSVATVSDNGAVMAIKEGTATITAKTEDGDKVATCAVTVTPTGIIEVTGITLDKEELSMTVGSKSTLTATISPVNATDKTVTWSSEDESIATVNDGEVTAIKAGTTTITATAGGKTARCTVTATGSLGQVSINDEAAVSFATGYLAEKFTGTVTKIVFGEGSELNGDDIGAMMGLSSSLEYLDMTKATIVNEGGAYYTANKYDPYYTSDYTIGNYMFEGMEKLQTVLLPANTKRIESAFNECPEITSYNIPEGVDFISVAFNEAHMESITLPASVDVTEVRYANNSLGALDNIYVAKGNTTMKSVDGVIYSSDGKQLYMVPRNRTSYDVPEGVTTLEGSSFDYSRITSLSLPASLTTIMNAIYNSQLTTLTIPANVTTMWSDAVSSNDNLTTMIINATVPPKTLWDGDSDIIVSNNENLTAIYVPNESVEAYKTAKGWKSNAEIIKPISEMP
jgi:uncharacterized protein YjdB